MLRDVNGKEYTDALACLWNVNCGHGRRELAEAAREQVAILEHSFAHTGFPNMPPIKVAAKLAQMT